MVTKNSGSSKGQDDTKLFAVLGVVLTIIGFIIAIVAKKDNKYVMYYGKQGLIIFFAFVISAACVVIPLIGPFISGICYLISIVLWIIGIVYSTSGKEKPIPYIGKYADMIDI